MIRIAVGESLDAAIEAARIILVQEGGMVETDHWQGIKAPQPFWEFMNLILHAPMPNEREKAVEQCKPNLPWADLHFQERIGGLPLNPGESYKVWPFYGRDKEMKVGEQFSHSYMERLWPKYAGKFSDSTMIERGDPKKYDILINSGIREFYGDLKDVINLLIKDPSTRQAYLPIFFPEDTGSVHGGRVPCTLGYLFMIRDGILHCTYHIRSCDFLRHFRDDIYLAVRLCQLIKAELNLAGVTFFQEPLELGELTMHITSLHIFEAELPRISKTQQQ